jgi:DNA sulfur modification protein DndD
MKIKFLGWRSEGMRCPDAELKFEKGNIVDVIQMNNGTGKTTTLELIQIALSGPDIDHSDSRDVILKSNPGDYVHMNNLKGYFEVDMAFDENLYTFRIEIEKNSDKIKFSTISPLIGGKNSGYMPPDEVAPFLSIDFVKIIVFDGEKAESLFEEGEVAKDTIDTLCQFNILDKAKNTTDNYIKEKLKADGLGAGVRANETRAINDYEKYSNRLKTVKLQRKNLDKEIKKQEADYKKLDEKVGAIKANSEKYKKQFEAIKTAKEELKGNITECKNSILMELQNPMQANESIKKQLVNFTSHLEKLRLPDSVAGPFFRELSEEPSCICGREIGVEQKKTILDNEKKYLDDSTQGTLNTIKEEVISTKDYEDNLSILIENLRKADKESQRLMTDEKKMEKKIANGDKGFEDDLKKLTILEKTIEDNLEALDVFDCPNDTSLLNNPIDQIYSIATLIKHVDHLEKEVSQKKEAYQLLAAGKIFNEIIDEAVTNASNFIHENIKESSQKLLDVVLESADPRIEIKSVDRYIKLNRPNVSQGQRLATAYVFITSALKYAKVDVPLVVDSPVGKISNDVRVELGAAIPKLTSQFITFIIDSEKQAFLEKLHEEAKPKGSYTTIFWLNEKVKKWLKTNLDEDEIKEVTKKGNFGVLRGYNNMMRYDITQKQESNE